MASTQQDTLRFDAVYVMSALPSLFVDLSLVFSVEDVGKSGLRVVAREQVEGTLDAPRLSSTERCRGQA